MCQLYVWKFAVRWSQSLDAERCTNNTMREAETEAFREMLEDRVRSPVDGALDGALALRRGEVRDCATNTRHGRVPVNAFGIRHLEQYIGDMARYSRRARAGIPIRCEYSPCVVDFAGLELDFNNLTALDKRKQCKT